MEWIEIFQKEILLLRGLVAIIVPDVIISNQHAFLLPELILRTVGLPRTF